MDAHQATSVAGLYAAGDVVRGLNQIAVAGAEAAVAATAIHNALREADGWTEGLGQAPEGRRRLSRRAP